MFYYSFIKFIINCMFNLLIEVLKKFIDFRAKNIQYSLAFFSIPLWSDEITYYIFTSLFDLFFFSHILNFNMFFFPHLALFSFFSFVQFYFGNFIFCFKFFTFFFFGCFLLASILSVFFFVFLFAVALNFLETVLKSNIAGLVVFSRDFLSIEDEDLWVSSNIFYFDDKLIEAKKFKMPLTAHEIEVFSTIIKLFFNVPNKNVEYHKYANQIMTFRKDLRNHSENVKLNRTEALENYFATIYQKQKIPFDHSQFSIPFLKITNLNDLIFRNPFYLQSSKLFYVNPRIYYPSFFNFIIRLLRLKSSKITAKKKKLKAKRQARIKRSYLTFQKRVYFWKYKGRNGILPPKISKNFNFEEFSQLPMKESETFITNDLLLKNKESSQTYIKSLKENITFFSPSQKFSDEAFMHFRRPTMVNKFNNTKSRRFRYFFWISFPLYILEVNNLFISFIRSNKLLILLETLYKSTLSKFLYFIFSLLGNDSVSESNLLFSFITNPYEPSKKINRINDNFLYFLKTKPVLLNFILTSIQAAYDLETSDKRQLPEDLVLELNLSGENLAEIKERRLQQINNPEDEISSDTEIFKEEEDDNDDDDYLDEEEEIENEDEDDDFSFEEEEEEDEEEEEKKEDKDKDKEKESKDKLKDKDKKDTDEQEASKAANKEEKEFDPSSDDYWSFIDEDDAKKKRARKKKKSEDKEATINDPPVVTVKDSETSNSSKKKFIKKGTALKQALISSKDYVFSNKYNTKSFIAHPRLELVDFYRLLEYFYFTLTDDIDFYDLAQFTGRVIVLRRRFGRAIVNDLLTREDHKQAKKVSMQMHIIDYDYEQVSKNAAAALEESNAFQAQEDLKAKFFKQRNDPLSQQHASNFIDDLILSYKYRFRK